MVKGFAASTVTIQSYYYNDNQCKIPATIVIDATTTAANVCQTQTCQFDSSSGQYLSVQCPTTSSSISAAATEFFGNGKGFLTATQYSGSACGEGNKLLFQAEALDLCQPLTTSTWYEFSESTYAEYSTAGCISAPTSVTNITVGECVPAGNNSSLEYVSIENASKNTVTATKSAAPTATSTSSPISFDLYTYYNDNKCMSTAAALLGYSSSAMSSSNSSCTPQDSCAFDSSSGQYSTIACNSTGTPSSLSDAFFPKATPYILIGTYLDDSCSNFFGFEADAIGVCQPYPGNTTTVSYMYTSTSLIIYESTTCSGKNSVATPDGSANSCTSNGGGLWIKYFLSNDTTVTTATKTSSSASASVATASTFVTLRSTAISTTSISNFCFLLVLFTIVLQ